MRPLIDVTAVRLRPAGVVRVAGADRLVYLHNLLSQHLADARPGDVADFLHLDAKGVVQALGRAVVHAEAVLLVTPPEVAGTLATTLDRMRFLMDVAVTDESGALALASVRGPDVAVPGARSEPMTAAPHGDGLVVRGRSGGVDLLGARSWVEERVADLGLPEASAEDWEAWRIGAGEPAWGAEVTPGRRAQELGLLPTHVHLRKGCYPGQESIAKTFNLGRPRRALAVLNLDAPVETGAEVDTAAGAGTVTSAAATPEGSVALALLPVDRATGELPEDATVTAAGTSGRVLRRVGADLPLPGAPEPRPAAV